MSAFGFDMGAKMGEFGFFKSNNIAPVVPQPQYLVVQIDMTNSAGALTYSSEMNTMKNGSVITSVVNDYVDTIPTTIINFSTSTFEDSAYLYLQGRFVNWYENDNTNGVPTYQVEAIDTLTYQIRAICWDRSPIFAIGTFELTFIIFE
jgi:hypothetical protein